MSDQLNSELDAKLKCIFAGIGEQIGEVLRCLIESEMASHVARIEQLQAVLSGNVCLPTTTESPSTPLGEAPPAA